MLNVPDDWGLSERAKEIVRDLCILGLIDQAILYVDVFLYCLLGGFVKKAKTYQIVITIWSVPRIYVNLYLLYAFSPWHGKYSSNPKDVIAHTSFFRHYSL